MAQVVAVHGIQSTIQYLQRFEREVFNDVKKDLIKQAQPLVQRVASEFPDKPFDTSGTNHWVKYGRTERGRKSADSAGPSFPRWQATKVRRGVKADTGARRRRSDGTYTILRIKQTDAAASIFDLAKNTNVSGFGENFVKLLNTKMRGKPQSRVMYPTVEKNLTMVIGQVERILAKIEKRYSAEIASDTMMREAASARAKLRTRNVLGQFGS